MTKQGAEFRDNAHHDVTTVVPSRVHTAIPPKCPTPGNTKKNDNTAYHVMTTRHTVEEKREGKKHDENDQRTAIPKGEVHALPSNAMAETEGTRRKSFIFASVYELECASTPANCPKLTQEPFDELSARIFCPKLAGMSHLMSSQLGFLCGGTLAQRIQLTLTIRKRCKREHFN